MTQTEELQQIETQPEEVTLSDGQTDNLQEITPEMVTQPANSNNSQEQAFSSDFSTMMTMNSGKYYSQSEFSTEFNNFLTFLKSPDTAADTYETLRAEGQELAAAKIYQMAYKYKWLRFLIDKRTQAIHDFAVISIFAATETNAIVMNWTGINLKDKVKIWLKSKVKQRAEVAQKSGKRSVWGFLGRQAAEKAPSQENSLKD